MSAHHYAIFSARYLPEVGGIESFTASLGGELVKQGKTVSIVTNAISVPTGCVMQADGTRVIRLPCHSLMNGRLPLVSRSGKQTREVLEDLKRTRVTHALVNARFYDMSLLGLRVAGELDVPVIVLDHGSAYLTLGNEFLNVVLKAYEHAITRFGMRFTPQYAGISSMSTQWLTTFGIKTDVVIPNAIDAPSFRDEASSKDYRSALSISDDQTLIASVGRLAIEKGSCELVEAGRLLGKRVHIAIAGDGPLRKELEKNLPENVTLLGNLPHSELSALLRDADLFCLPTRSEGFCTSLLEAGAWGLMPIMTHVGGTDEVMGHPLKFGLLLDSMEPQTIAQAVEDAIGRGIIGHSDELRRHVEEHCSWEATVKALEDAFNLAI